MITFILLGFFFLLAILFAAVAYTANQRPRAGMKEIATGRKGSRHRSQAGKGQID